MRINSYLASCGLGSRRSVESLIKDGRIFINGKVAELGSQVTDGDRVCLGKKEVKPIGHRYFLLNKPKGFAVTMSDPHIEKTIKQFIPENLAVFPVGRLDQDSEGLIILTNDGDFAQRYIHPKFSYEKEYLVEVRMPAENAHEMLDDAQRLFKCGVIMDGRRTKPSFCRVIKQEENVATFRIVMKEGKNRQIRRVFARAGLKVKNLKRIRIGEFRLEGLASGEIREIKKP